MHIFAILVVVIVLLDMYHDWVTPYLEEVEAQRGPLAAYVEAFRIIEMHA